MLLGRHRRGVTLVEMLLVVSIVGLMVGVTFPSVSSGVDSLRLSAACDSIASFLNGALNRAARRQEVMEVTILKAERALTLRSSEPGFLRRLELPDGVSIARVIPDAPVDPNLPRHIVLYPAGAIPRFGIELENRRGARRIVRVDPVTGAPEIERLEAK